MFSVRKNEKHKKFATDCAFGEKCSRHKCSFKHPDGWNIAANQRRIQQQGREDLAQLQLQQRLRWMNRCQHSDLCRQLDCHFTHSPDWNPKRNQQSFEEKRRRNEQKKEEQRKNAYDISTKETIDENIDFNHCRSQKNLLQKHLIGEEYEYDDEYIHIQEKIWEKQIARHAY